MTAIILAAGTGSRMKAGRNKVFLPLLGREMLLYTVEAFRKSKSVKDIIVVTGKEDIKICESLLLGFEKVKCIIEGGKTRQESSYIGVKCAESEYVMIHDAARALITCEDIDLVAETVKKTGAAAVGTPCIDTMKMCKDGKIISTIDRENLYKIYTPQAFLRDKLLEIHKKAKDSGIVVTDDCALYEWAGETVEMVIGSPSNIKITTPEDIIVAEAILNNRNK